MYRMLIWIDSKLMYVYPNEGYTIHMFIVYTVDGTLKNWIKMPLSCFARILKYIRKLKNI